MIGYLGNSESLEENFGGAILGADWGGCLENVEKWVFVDQNVWGFNIK